MINNKGQLQDISISLGSDMLTAIKQMDEVKTKLLIVLRDGKFFSMLSIGDIQRALIRGKAIQSSIDEILRPDSKINVARISDSFESIKKLMLKNRVEFMPVINNENEVIKIYFLDEVAGIDTAFVKEKIDFPVVIMAGGKGTRLKPLTNVIPKALVPVGENPIVEKIINRFNRIGVNQIYLTVNYKHELIKQYFDGLQDKAYHIEYIIEQDFLGTAGSLSMLKDKINTTFFVSNCDILIDQDYSEVYEYHRQNNNELTIVAGLVHYPIPYGTLQSGENGRLLDIQEKPELTFLVNSGMYVLEPHLLEEIPENTFYHITELIEKIKNSDRKVGVFPVSEKSWIDMGQWNDYLKILDNLSQ